MTTIDTMLNTIEEIKEKITDQQYKTLIENLSAIKINEYYKIRYYIPTVQTTFDDNDIKLSLEMRETIVDICIQTPAIYDLYHLNTHSVTRLDFPESIDIPAFPCEHCDEVADCRTLHVRNGRIIIVSCEKFNFNKQN